jgi:dipeptidyl aminopeptidase/acylaminoacyl peptidase
MGRFVPLAVLFACLLLPGPVSASEGPEYAVAYSRSDGVYVAGTGGASQRILAGYGHGDLAWSSDGRYLAFSRHDPKGIYVATADGREQWRVTRREGAPRWSPDGRKIAYVSGRALYVVGWDGKAPRRLLRSRGRSIAWVDGSHIVCACLDRLVVLDTNRPGSRIISTRHADGNLFLVAASSDGARIAYGRHCYDTVFGGDTFCEITVINADGTGKHTVVPYAKGRSAGPADVDPVWIPGSDRLLVSRFGGLHDLQRVQDEPPLRTTVRPDAGDVLAAAADGSFAYGKQGVVLVCAADGSVRARVAVGSDPAPAAVVFH